MKIILTTVGTRGDIEPFLAIGEMLHRENHHVICAFPEQFRVLVEESDLAFRSLGNKFIEMLNSNVGRQVMGSGGSGLQKFRAILKLVKMQKSVNAELISRQYEIIQEEMPDRIIRNGKAIYPVIWEVENPGKTTYVSAIPYLHYIKGHTHVAFNSNYGEFLNKLTYKLADWGLLRTIVATAKNLKSPEINKGRYRNILRDQKIIYTISPSLLPRPHYWPENM